MLCCCIGSEVQDVLKAEGSVVVDYGIRKPYVIHWVEAMAMATVESGRSAIRLPSKYDPAIFQCSLTQLFNFNNSGGHIGEKNSLEDCLTGLYQLILSWQKTHFLPTNSFNSFRKMS